MAQPKHDNNQNTRVCALQQTWLLTKQLHVIRWDFDQTDTWKEKEIIKMEKADCEDVCVCNQ